MLRRLLALVPLATLASTLLAADAAPPAWMAGLWTGVDPDGVEMEELWTPAKGGSMLGLHRDVKSGKTESFEFLRVEATADGVTYWASPKGRPATPFRMVASESVGNRIVFSNPEHAYPTRILYWLSSDGLLHARIEGTLNGKPASEEWAWTRAR
jgi:hypothetical protein